MRNEIFEDVKTAAGASLIFLGILDVSFNFISGLYALGVQETVFNLVINFACLSFGTFLLLAIWRIKRMGNQPVFSL